MAPWHEIFNRPLPKALIATRLVVLVIFLNQEENLGESLAEPNSIRTRHVLIFFPNIIGVYLKIGLGSLYLTKPSGDTATPGKARSS